jgi:hypothetical protein
VDSGRDDRGSAGATDHPDYLGPLAYAGKGFTDSHEVGRRDYSEDRSSKFSALEKRLFIRAPTLSAISPETVF